MKKVSSKRKFGKFLLLAILLVLVCGAVYQIKPEPETVREEHTEDAAVQPAIDSLPPYSGEPYTTVNGNIPFFTEEELTADSYEYYSPLDEKGRCGVCVASVGTDIMPTEKRGEIGEVKPTGWKQVKYAGLVDGNYLYNRCHLIGYQLAGENANIRNLITGTRFLNTEGMVPFENMVADYVRETGNHVMYRVTPIFEGDNLLASGVLMEGKSVEDSGRGILFCVYCYNVQPGVNIDYTDGASALEEEMAAATFADTDFPEKEEEERSISEAAQGQADEPADKASMQQSAEETAVQQQGAQPPEQQPSDGSYAVNGNNGKIHIVGACPASGNDKGAMNNPVYFDTYEEAENYSIQIAPYEEKRKCGNCW